MADLPEALGAALSARYGWAEPKRPATHRQGLTARMGRIQSASGGNRRAAAKAAGIPYSTWGDWLTGRRHPSPKNLRKLEGAFARIVMAPAIAAKIKAKGYPTIIGISAVVVGDPQGRRYKNRKQDGPPGGTLEEGWRTFAAGKDSRIDARSVVQAWLHHGNEAAAEALGRAVERGYGSPFGFEGNQVSVTLEGKE